MGAKLGLSHTLRMFEDRMLRRIFGPKREEITRNGGASTPALLTKYYLGDEIREEK